MQEKRIHQIFLVSVSLKGLHALIEIVGGLALYLLSVDAIARWLDEIDRNDWIARHFPTSEQHFYAFYLLSHGLVKAVLVVGLLREKLWAYPASIAVFGAVHRLSALPLQLHARHRTDPAHRSSTCS